MPTRLLYEKICVSETLAALTAEEERFFYRLMVKADDHGRFYAQPSILLGHLFSLQLDSITHEMVGAWRDRLAEVGLIEVYESGGREYLAYTTWPGYQRQRGNKPKFPPPPEHSNATVNDDASPEDVDSPQSAADCGDLPQVAARASSRPGTYSGDLLRGLTPEDGAAAPPAPSPEIKSLDVPEPLAAFHAVLSETQGYAPSATFFEAVSERYSELDLREQALKMASWLADPTANKRKQRATQRFVLDWLKRESTGPPARPTRNGSAQHKPKIERMPVVVRRH